MKNCFLVSLFSLAAAFASPNDPNPALLEELFRSRNFSRYSDNIIEDARMDVPELVQKYNYPLEIHTVTTEDGYILNMHRIPHGRDNFRSYDSSKPVVFLMHGILSSSADWLLMGPGSGFAYILVEQGFDVWLGNARGNYYSRKHISLNPDALLSTKYWEFSWDEIGNIDVPTMVDYVLEQTGKSKLHYVGHSQGTTAFFVLNSLRPEYNDKFISMHALAPVAFMASNRNLFLLALAPFSKNIERMASLIGIGELMPNSLVMTWAGQSMCMDEAFFQPVCSNMLFLICGWNTAEHNATMFPVKLGHTPAGSSVRQFAHFGQSISDRDFRRYDHGWYRNRRRYGRRTPPSYDLSKVTTPVFLHYSDNDPMAHTRDVDRLFRALGRPIGKFLVPDRKFSHLDFLWAINAKDLIFNRVINLIWAMEN